MLHDFEATGPKIAFALVAPFDVGGDPIPQTPNVAVNGVRELGLSIVEVGDLLHELNKARDVLESFVADVIHGALDGEASFLHGHGDHVVSVIASRLLDIVGIDILESK
jgi:hypothetical protein